MDLVQVLTVIGVAIANIGTTITLFMWSTNRSEENRKELKATIDENNRETNRLIEAIHQEMKDFHGRLCTIESRRNST
jgi:hypothetical protein